MRIGIDLGGTSVKAALCADDGAILIKQSVPTRTGDPDGLREDMKQLALALCEAGGVQPDEVESIGIGVPGTYDKVSCTLKVGTNLGMNDICFSQAFRPEFVCAVQMDNDANCAALGEATAGAAKNIKNMLMVTLGTGVGGGIVIDGKLYTGYSNYTARVTYSAVINADKTFVYGEKGNENTVILTWKRTSGDYYDTLIDDCHVFSFGLDLTKLFSDVDAETAAETKLYDSVKFKIQNKTDGTWIIAKRNDAEGVYYVTGHTDKEADATVFTPVTMGKSYGHIMVKGLEEDTYTITEIQTANGYTLLKNAITVTISLKENPAKPCNVYAKDVLGVLQNDPHYAFDGGEDLKLANIPQRALSHNVLTASATVDKNDVTMLEDNGSANAEVPLTVKNTKGFDLPKTGDHGTWMYSLVGILLMSTAAGVIVLTVKKKNGR